MSELQRNEEWSLVLQPKRGLLSINLRELYHYRDLIWMFANRDFVTVYKQTILGPLWFILNPLFTTIVYVFVFGGLAKIPTDGIPPTLFYYSGTMLWGYFATSFNNVADTFSNNLGLFGKVYFPRLVVPIGRVLTNLVSAGIQLASLACFYLYYVAIGKKIAPTWGLIALPLLFLQVAMLAIGTGMIVTALTTKYRDIRQLVSFGVSLWMYATPVVYPLSQIPEKWRWIAWINPLSAPVECSRIVLFGVGNVSASLLAASAGLTIILLLVGVILFNQSEQSFVDVI